MSTRTVGDAERSETSSSAAGSAAGFVTSVFRSELTFASDYAIWTPRWLIEKFVDFQIPEDMTEYAPLTTAQKKKILGLNAAKMYGLDVPAELRLPEADEPETGPRGADDTAERAQDPTALAGV